MGWKEGSLFGNLELTNCARQDDSVRGTMSCCCWKRGRGDYYYFEFLGGIAEPASRSELKYPQREHAIRKLELSGTENQHPLEKRATRKQKRWVILMGKRARRRRSFDVPKNNMILTGGVQTGCSPFISM
jgi:hypothetical protein